VDKTTPMKDVVIPDTMLGYPVVDASECFKGCHNVASVAHIPTECLKFGDVKDMFAESGLRVIPEQLDSRLACLACSKAYAVPGVENLSKEHFYGREENIGEIMFATRRIAEFEEYKERDTLMMDEGLSKYQNFERVSFVYNFQPVSVVRVQDEEGKWLAINPDGPREHEGYSYSYNRASSAKTALVPYDAYMERFESSKIQGLTTDSFKPMSMEEGKHAIEAAYDKAIDVLKDKIERAQAEFDKKVTLETEKADGMQEGLDVTPKAVEPTQNTEKDEVAIETPDDHEL
jgi:hypothetical protein